MSITRTVDRSICRSNIQNAWPKLASSHPLAVSVTPMTMRLPRRSTARSRPGSSTTAVRGAASRLSNAPPCNGWISVVGAGESSTQWLKVLPPRDDRRLAGGATPASVRSEAILSDRKPSPFSLFRLSLSTPGSRFRPWSACGLPTSCLVQCGSRAPIWYACLGLCPSYNRPSGVIGDRVPVGTSVASASGSA